MPSLSDRERAVRQRLKDDFPHYAAKCLKIRTKSGAVEPLLLNAAQRYLHDRLEAQKAETGHVRALVLKGRQQGVSTYVGGRFYHRTTHQRGLQTFILTHEQSATDNLFGMVNRYHENNNPLVKPSTGAANAKELYFDRLDSGYSVGTAGARAVGRSKTIQLFHGSEVAFWPNAGDHFAGVVQAVPDLPGTEIILESTANGIGGEFHARWQQAESGVGDYQAIFIPWFWQPEYRRPVETGFVMTEAEREYASQYGLEPAQVAWMRAKREELGDPLLFKQEYPANATEAFVASGSMRFNSAEAVEMATRREVERDIYDPIVIGCDVARFGEDDTVIAIRKGRDARTTPWIAMRGADTMTVAAKVAETVRRYGADMAFVDETGIGSGVVDRLHQLNVPCIGVNFGSKGGRVMLPNGETIRVRNKRAEIWAKMRAWLAKGAIPNDRALVMDLVSPHYAYDSDNSILLERKEDMKKRGLRSPDRGDALALTFAFPVSKRTGMEGRAARKVGANRATGY